MVMVSLGVEMVRLLRQVVVVVEQAARTRNESGDKGPSCFSGWAHSHRAQRLQREKNAKEVLWRRLLGPCAKVDDGAHVPLAEGDAHSCVH